MSIWSLILTLILILWGLWGYVAYSFLSQMLNKNLKYLREPRVNFMKKSIAGARYDAINIRNWEVYFGAIFLAPIRLLASLPIFILMYVLVWPLKKFYGVEVENNQIPRGKFYMDAVYFGTQPAIIKSMLRLIGTRVEKRKHSIYDFIADYKPKQDISIAPVAISNHVSPWLDQFYYICEPYSFIARQLVAKSFYLGMFCTARQSLYFRKSSKKDRSEIVQRMNKRIEQVMQRKLPPFFIYPEGTTTNGRSLLTFKKGGFSHLRPLKIFCIEYQGRFLNSFTNIHPLVAIVISIGQLYNKITIHEVEEPLDPLWVAEKHGVSEDDPEFWKYFANEAREIMSFMGGMQLSNEGFRDINSFEKEECRKQFDIQFDLCDREGKRRRKKNLVEGNSVFEKKEH